MTATHGRGNREGTNGLKWEANVKMKGVRYRRRRREEYKITRMSKEVIKIILLSNYLELHIIHIYAFIV